MLYISQLGNQNDLDTYLILFIERSKTINCEKEDFLPLPGNRYIWKNKAKGSQMDGTKANTWQ